jgi:hypothetical protein
MLEIPTRSRLITRGTVRRASGVLPRRYERPRGAAAACLVAAMLLLASTTAPGCAESSDKPPQSPADRALSDPMNYGPKAEDYAARAKAADTKNRSGATDSDGFKRDLDHVFNP